jgi:hypothetical protein
MPYLMMKFLPTSVSVDLVHIIKRVLQNQKYSPEYFSTLCGLGIFKPQFCVGEMGANWQSPNLADETYSTLHIG